MTQSIGLANGVAVLHALAEDLVKVRGVELDDTHGKQKIKRIFRYTEGWNNFSQRAAKGLG